MSCLLNLLLVRSYQVEIIFLKRLMQGHNKVTRVQVEPRLFDQGSVVFMTTLVEWPGFN